jgi:hypothetical protein
VEYSLFTLTTPAILLAQMAMKQRPPTDHQVAKDPNPQPRPPVPAGKLAALTARAPRMEIHLMDDASLASRQEGEFSTWMEAQFNPTELEETIGVVWNEIAIPGLSHERRHYSHTKSAIFKFTLQFDGFEFMERSKATSADAGAEYVLKALNFLRSLGFAGVESKSPPRCLFYWPNFISLTATVDGEIAIKCTDFLQSGHLIRFSAAITLKEIRDAHMTRDDVLAAGNQRTSPPAGMVG